MARGDFFVFNERQVTTWDPADDIRIAILDDTATPALDDTNPQLGDYTEVGDAGTYVAGGTSLGTWGSMISEDGGVTTVDSAVNPSWAQDEDNDDDAHWGLVYNAAQSGDPALAFLDLGGPVDMSGGPLTLTWHGDGMFSVQRAVPAP